MYMCGKKRWEECIERKDPVEEEGRVPRQQEVFENILARK